MDKTQRREQFLKDHPKYNKGECTECMHCDKKGLGGRGLCITHYQATLKLKKEYSWEKLIEKGICKERQNKKGSIYYDELKNLLEK